MNKNELYQLAIDLWTDMADNCYDSKGKSKYAEQVKDMYNQCPLCEYHHTITNEGCFKCPLYKQTGRMCMDSGSLYNAWLYTVLNDPDTYSDECMDYEGLDKRELLECRAGRARDIVETIIYWVNQEGII